MSEYQYYEFVAVDLPLDDQQLDELGALSTRAEITRTSFVNTYHWGNFRGNPRVLMEKYFDAFLYLANWGTREVMLRLPANLLALDTAQQYCVGDAVTAWSAGEHVILAFTSEDEEAIGTPTGKVGWRRSSRRAPRSPRVICARCISSGCWPPRRSWLTTRSSRRCRRAWARSPHRCEASSTSSASTTTSLPSRPPSVRG